MGCWTDVLASVATGEGEIQQVSLGGECGFLPGGNKGNRGRIKAAFDL
jgi:hypothetical protein